MNSWRIIFRSLAFHRRIHLAVVLGVAAATAVLTGALLVGDSVRGSLRELALDRLGQIDQLLVADHFFRADLARELDAHPQFSDRYASAHPAILFPSATAELTTGQQGRAAHVLILGTEPEFWDLSNAGQRPQHPPGDDEIILNHTLASDLGAKVGDVVVLRFPKAEGVPEDSALGRTDDRLASLPELKVVEILPDAGLGRFSLQPTQTSPRSAFVHLEALQRALEEPGRANAIFVGGKNDSQPRSEGTSQALASMLQPKLEDFGLHLKHVRRTFDENGEEQVIYDYYSLTSDRMLIDEAAERQAMAAFEQYGAHPILTYLANLIEKIPAATDDAASAEKKEEKSNGIPYSTIAALDPGPDSPLTGTDGQPLPPLKAGEIAVNSWAAEDQGIEVGDRVRVTFFEPETTHGNEQESSSEFRVAAIVPLTEPSEPASRRQPAQYDQPPTSANDPDLTPEVKGITDKDSIDDWDAPFPFDYSLIRPQDDEYWENHRTTPKAFVSLAEGQKLWGSRFGDVTSIRIPAAAIGEAKGPGGKGAKERGSSSDADPGIVLLEEQFLAQLEKTGERLGLEFIPIRQQSLAASAGTTPFDVLFLLLSMFVIAAAILLVWLLFRLGVDQRASEVGLLVAEGWSRGKTTWLLTREGLIVAAIGAVVGVAAGVAYAWLMIMGLTTWWVDAITSPFLRLHVSPTSIVAGWLSGLVVCGLTIWLSLRALRRPSVRQLLAGETTPSPVDRIAERQTQSRLGRLTPLLIAALYGAAIVLAVLATQLSAEAQAGAFLSGGAAVLTATLMVIHRTLKGSPLRHSALTGWSLRRLALRSAGRNVGRSVATIALVASASFLIIAVSSFRLDPTDQGTGGFDLLGESSQPVFTDLNTQQGRDDTLADEANVLEGSHIFSLRLRGGDDASCRNLYQPSQPRVLGVPPAMVQHFDNPQATHFRFSASDATSEQQQTNPWHLLDEEVAAGEPVPVVLDQNTAMYSLRLYGGIGQTFPVTYANGEEVTFKVVGLLANSVLQGNLLIGEQNFKRLFPDISGYRYFLIDATADNLNEVSQILENRLGDEGLDVVNARQRLEDLLSVQNTYISTFQSLGALGLVLGTFGLAAVQLRSVFERRKELALLRASGFRRGRLGELVLLENLVLLLGGLLTGLLSAAVTVLPHWLLGGAHVPFLDLGIMLTVVLVVGLLTGLFAVRATLNAPLVAALRGD